MADEKKGTDDGGILSTALYGASIPERALRGMIGAASGVLKESAEVLVPDAMKGTKLYELAVRKMLRSMVADVGGLEVEGNTGPGAGAAAAQAADARAARMAVAQAVDLAGMTALHVSPLWVLAVVSDVTLGARTYLHALTEELKTQGVIERGETIRNVDDLLGSLQRFSGSLADRLDAPPVTIAELRRTVEEVRAEAGKIDISKAIPQAELERAWTEIQETAAREGLSVYQVSSALGMMALAGLSSAGKGAYGSVKAGVRLIGDNVLQHYFASLERIRTKGFYETLVETYEPYLRALRRLFDPATETLTGEVLTGRAFRGLGGRVGSLFRSVASCLSGGSSEAAPPPAGASDDSAPGKEGAS
jgi:hypothetical protein